MNLKKLLIIHAVLTLAASIALVLAPWFIPATVNIVLRPDAYLLSYFLAASELGIAYLSFRSIKIKDTQFLRLVSSTLVVFHAATAALELFAFTQGLSSKIFYNIALRVIIVFLFSYYGIYKNRQEL